jgi:KDO2-lipid IV(A) lauroyltransferase
MLTNQTPVFYTSDQDHGIASASFVPFFNIPAATVNVLPKLIRKYQATLLLCLPQITPKGYEIKIEKDQQITNLSQENEDEKALIAMNKWFEEVITQNPEQYLWMHRRFKTRPKNIPNVYTAF